MDFWRNINFKYLNFKGDQNETTRYSIFTEATCPHLHIETTGLLLIDMEAKYCFYFKFLNCKYRKSE